MRVSGGGTFRQGDPSVMRLCRFCHDLVPAANHLCAQMRDAEKYSQHDADAGQEAAERRYQAITALGDVVSEEARRDAAMRRLEWCLDVLARGFGR